MESRKEYFTLERQGPKPGCCDRRGTCCACLLFLGILLLIAGLVTLLCFLIMLSAEPGPTVETPCGPIHGMYHARAKAFVYKGIPYAKPPVGELRWKDSSVLIPEEPEEEGGEAGTCWEGTLEARHTPNQCVHYHADPATNTSTVAGHEDCLYLDIYIPDLKFSDHHQKKMDEKEESRKRNNETEPTPEPEPVEGANMSLPVMFYIHGDRMEEPFMPPMKLAEELGVIIVVPQYRMSALGFLVLENFESDQMGNYGMGDIIQALKWVKSNIKPFGGDPKKVTIFGAGKGATAVWGLLTSTTARGLFARAWVMSGSTNIRTEMADAAAANNYVWEESGCQDPACILEMSAENITKIYEMGRVPCPYNGLPKLGENSSPEMVAFGHFGNPLEDYHSGGTGVSDVPILIGSAAQSIDYNPAPGTDLKSWNLTTLTAYLDEHLKDFGEDVAKNALDLYNLTNKDSEYIYTTIVSDIRYICQQEDLAFAASDHITQPVYRYVMRIGPSSGANLPYSDFTAKYAFQGWDLLTFFGTLGEVLEGGATEEDENMRKVLLESVEKFVSKGELGMPWNEFPDTTALLSNEIAFTSRRYNKDMCHYWHDLALQSYYATR